MKKILARFILCTYGAAVIVIMVLFMDWIGWAILGSFAAVFLISISLYWAFDTLFGDGSGTTNWTGPR